MGKNLSNSIMYNGLIKQSTSLQVHLHCTCLSKSAIGSSLLNLFSIAEVQLVTIVTSLLANQPPVPLSSLSAPRSTPPSCDGGTGTRLLGGAGVSNPPSRGMLIVCNSSQRLSGSGPAAQPPILKATPPVFPLVVLRYQ